jgi:adenylate cyclase
MQQQQFEQFVRLLDQHLDQSDYSVTDLCHELGISRSKLSHFVRDQSGLTLSLYIRRHRLHKARSLLETTNLLVVEISDAVGIDSPQTFTKYFTQEFGKSPTEYRKKILAGEVEPIPAPWENRAKVHGQELPVPEGPDLPRWRLHRGLWIALGIGLIGLTAGLYVRFSPSFSPESTLAPSVAILPFQSQRDPGVELVAGGMVDQVHASLASVEGLIVISKTSSELFRDSKKTLPQIALELGVNYVLTGSVTHRAGRVHVSVELVKALENRTIWARNFDGDLNQVINFMNTVAQQITVELNQKLSASESKKMTRLPTRNPKAFNEYLRGKQLLQGRTNEKLLASIRHFERAIALEPSFSDAFAHKGLAYFLLGSHSFIDIFESIRLGEENSLAAIRLDEENGLAYATLANGYRQLNKWEQALTTYQIALKHSPNDALINYWYSITLRALGRFDEAIHYGNRALILDPLYPTIIAGHIGNYSYAGRFEEAWQLIEDNELELKDFFIYYYVRGFYYLNRNDPRSALREFMKSETLNQKIPFLKIMTLYCQARLGEKAPAEAHLKTLTDSPENYINFSILYAGLGDRDNCLRYLELGGTLGIAPEYLKISPLFRFLRGDPRFEQVLRQLGLA